MGKIRLVERSSVREVLVDEAKVGSGFCGHCKKLRFYFNCDGQSISVF